MNKAVALLLALCLALSGCAAAPAQDEAEQEQYFTFLDEEPISLDPQCLSDHFTAPLNLFDRLVETVETKEGVELTPSLAQSWELSEDARTYTFHLRADVSFSNGAPLTAEDVEYSLSRLLTHPDSKHAALAAPIQGAEALRSGTSHTLQGVRVLDELTLTVTLEEPSSAFLSGLSTPGASILDRETTEAAGDHFGRAPRLTVGTGPFVFKQWKRGKQLVLTANPGCWSGAPRCEGLKMVFRAPNTSILEQFQNGELDLLDAEQLGLESEYLLRGDVYRDKLMRGRQVGLYFLGLNQSVQPLDDRRVRRALQLALDREKLMQAAIGGRGVLENGIVPHGMAGHNEQAEPIAYDAAQAKALLREAGLEEGFALTLSYAASEQQSERDLLELTAAMWRAVGVDARVEALEDETFEQRKRRGALACCLHRWSAECDDPDSVFSRWFGSEEDSRAQSLCCQDPAVFEDVARARRVLERAERLRSYQALEHRLVQEDAAIIPLYEKLHFFAVADRVSGFRPNWNGAFSRRFDQISVQTRR